MQHSYLKYMEEDILYMFVVLYSFIYGVCIHVRLFVLKTSQNTLHTAGGSSPVSPEKAIDSLFPY